MKLKKLLIRLGCPVLFFAICGLVLYPVYERARDNLKPRSCQSNLKQIGLGVAQYIQDYNGEFPSVMASGAHFGWADSIQPYVKSRQILRCPSLDREEQKQAMPRSIGYSDYWYNERLQGIEERNVNNPALTILSGDGNDGHDATNARYSLSELPPEWVADKKSPAYRHLDGANYGFADGHVKWFMPEKIKSSMVDGGPTFAIR